MKLTQKQAIALQAIDKVLNKFSYEIMNCFQIKREYHKLYFDSLKEWEKFNQRLKKITPLFNITTGL